MRIISVQDIQVVSIGKIGYPVPVRSNGIGFENGNGGDKNYMTMAGLNNSGAFSDLDNGNYALPNEPAHIAMSSTWSIPLMAQDCQDGALAANSLASFTGVNKTVPAKVAAGMIGCLSYVLGRAALR